MQKGFLLRFDFERLPPRSGDPDADAVWVQKDSIAQGWARIMMMNRRVLTVDTNSDYRKFQVDVRLLRDSVRPLAQK